MTSKPFLIVSLLILVLVSCESKVETKTEPESNKLQFVMDELHYSIQKQSIIEPERFKWYYQMAYTIGGLADDFDPIETVAISDYEQLKSSYTLYLDTLYSKIPASEIKYKERINAELTKLDYTKHKEQIPATIYFTTSLALLDIQQHLDANTLYIDSVTFYQEANAPKEEYKLARFVLNQDTAFCSPAGLVNKP